MNTVEMYGVMQENCRIAVGDSVKILRKAASCENGWDEIWVKEMTSCIGKTGRVIDIPSGSKGILVRIPDGGGAWCFPFFVLELVKKGPATDGMFHYD